MRKDETSAGKNGSKKEKILPQNRQICQTKFSAEKSVPNRTTVYLQTNVFKFLY